jgi:uncharacterized membrane protein YciS (DUF1049 family)
LKKNGLRYAAILTLLGGKLHLLDQGDQGGIPVKVSGVFNDRKARKWMWIALGALVALQMYFVRELLAALALFTVVFILGAVVALGFYLIDRASRWGLGLAEQQTKRALAAAEEISKKQLHRPRSEPAQ